MSMRIRATVEEWRRLRDGEVDIFTLAREHGWSESQTGKVTVERPSPWRRLLASRALSPGVEP